MDISNINYDRGYQSYDRNLGTTSMEYARDWAFRLIQDPSIRGAKISYKDAAELKSLYAAQWGDWEKEATKDINDPDIIGDDMYLKDAALDELNDTKVGDKTAGEVRHEEAGKNAGNITTSYAATAGGVLMLTVGKEVGKEVGEKIGQKSVEKLSEKAAEKAGTEAAKKAAEKATGVDLISLSISAAFALATGILYEATRPNQDAMAALNELNKLLSGERTNELNDATQTLDDLGGEVTDRGEEAVESEEQLQAELEVKQALYKTAKAIYDELIAKYEANPEEFTEEDIANLQGAGENINLLGEEIKVLSERLTTMRTEKAEAVEEKESQYNDKQNDIVYAQEQVTQTQKDAATTKGNVIAEIIGQGLNAASGFVTMGIAIARAATAFAGIVTAPLGAAFTAVAVAAGAGAGMSTHGVVEQGKFAKELGDIEGTTDKVATLADSAQNSFEANYNLKDVNATDIDGIEDLDTSFYEGPVEIPPETGGEPVEGEPKKEEEV